MSRLGVTMCQRGCEVEIQALTKTLPGGRIILDSVDMSLKPGDAAVITGPSGSGKTCLAHVVAGLDRDFQGTRTISCASGREGDDIRISVIFQDGGLFENLTSLENLCLAALLNNEEPEARKRSLNLLEELSIASLAGVRVKGLSAGERQRIALARALITDPDLIIADEPTACLDSRNARTVGGMLLQGAGARGATLLTITHDQELAGSFRNHFTMLDGRLCRAGSEA